MCNGFIIPNTSTYCETINAILINVWNKNEESNNQLEIEIENEYTKLVEILPLEVTKVIWNNEFMNYNMYNKLLYMKKYTYQDVSEILELYDKNKGYNWYIIQKNDVKLVNKMNNKNSRFLQRFIIKKLLSSNTCEWLIDNALEYETLWKTNENDICLPKNYIDIMKNDITKSFIKEMLQTVCDEVNNVYNINSTKNNMIEITHILLCEYNKNNMTMVNNLKMVTHKNQYISVEIMINKNVKNNKQGHLMFEDGLSMIQEQGDMVIYSNEIGHCVKKITSADIIVYKIIIHMKINEDE